MLLGVRLYFEFDAGYPTRRGELWVGFLDTKGLSTLAILTHSGVVGYPR